MANGPNIFSNASCFYNMNYFTQAVNLITYKVLYTYTSGMTSVGGKGVIESWINLRVRVKDSVLTSTFQRAVDSLKSERFRPKMSGMLID